MRDYLRSKSFIVTKERARGMRPVLRWIKEGAPRKRERDTAARLLRELEIPGDTKQVLLNRDEADMYIFVVTEFPEGVDTGRQLSFDFNTPTTELKSPTRHYGRSASGELVELPKPGYREEKESPQVRTELTEEEQDARESIGLPRLGRGQRSSE